MKKTLAQYLSEHGGSHEAALTAMHADLVAEQAATEREAAANIRARTIAQQLEPLAEFLDLPLPPAGQRPTQDATTALTEAVAGAMESVTALIESRDEWMGLAGDAGLDLEALEKADEADYAGIIDGWLTGLKTPVQAAEATGQELAIYKFAQANGLNPEAVKLQKGLEKLEAREIKSTGADGKEVTSTVWGLPGEGDTFKPATEHLKPVLDALRLTPAKPDGTPWVNGQEGRANSTGKDALDKAIEARQSNSSKAVDPFTHVTTQSPTTI